ncbi:hypothetical protein LBMAG42_33650 [Deltaproteobacteria bacterium]|nr:hypothetical protein LBMAG42_33650 [Deltaproteobacteria bacterium]
MLPLLWCLGSAMAAEPEPVADRLVLADGQYLNGHVRPGENTWLLTLADGTELSIPYGSVARVEWDVGLDPAARSHTFPQVPGWPGGPATWPQDPDADRYLLWPTGRSVGAGHGSLSQREVAGSIASYDITDFWEVSAGAIIPLMFSSSTQTAAIGSRLSSPIGDHGSLAVGFEALFLPYESVLGVPHAAVTLDYRRVAFTLGGGAAFGSSSWVGDTLDSVAIVGGSVRLGPRVWFLSETWLVVGDHTQSVVWAFPSLAFRMITRRVSFDAGLMGLNFGYQVIPLPVFNVSWHFPGSAF